MATVTAAPRRRSNQFVRLSSVPLNILFITIVASWLGMAGTIVLGYPLWVIGVVTILPWIPIFFSEALWKYRHYGWFAIFGITMVVQCLHFVEHIAQIVEVDVVGWPRQLSTGILGSLDLEPVHFTFDTTLLILTTILLFGKFRRNIPLWIAWVVAIWHTAEHWYITYFYFFDRCNYDLPVSYAADGCKYTAAHPGLLAREGMLGQGGLLWPGSPFPRIELHFIYNLLYTVPLVWAFILVIRQAYDEYLKKAFPRLSEAQLANINNSLESVEAEPGQLIIRQGDPADKFYIIARGEVEILQEAGVGQPTVLNRLKAGQFFGEVGLLTGAPRNASVRAVTRCDLLTLDRDTFQAVMGSSAPTAQDYAQVLAQRSGAHIPAVVAPGSGPAVGGPPAGVFPSGGGAIPPGGSSGSGPAVGYPSGPNPVVPGPVSGPTVVPAAASQPPVSPTARTFIPPPVAPPDPPTVVAATVVPPPAAAPEDDIFGGKTITERAPQFRPASSGWVYGLIFSSGAQAGQGVVLSAERMQIGRDISNEIRLTDDSQVSRRHAELVRMPTGTYQIRDLGSSNGVFVNHQRIAAGQPITLQENDEVRVGQSTFALRRVGARVV
jgi:hypothetical protein